MRRILLLVAVLGLVAAACSGANVVDTPTDTAPSDTTSAPDEAQSDGPMAHDFELALQPTGEFVLSQEVKPVYMVFWAEW